MMDIRGTIIMFDNSSGAIFKLNDITVRTEGKKIIYIKDRYMNKIPMFGGEYLKLDLPFSKSKFYFTYQSMNDKNFYLISDSKFFGSETYNISKVNEVSEMLKTPVVDINAVIMVVKYL